MSNTTRKQVITYPTREQRVFQCACLRYCFWLVIKDESTLTVCYRGMT